MKCSTWFRSSRYRPQADSFACAPSRPAQTARHGRPHAPPRAIQRGEPDAAGALLAQVYAELRQIARSKMARENPGHTLQPTALVHEAWLRLGDQSFENRAHFFSAAAEAMRRILIDSARRKLAVRHGGNFQRTELDSINMPAVAPDKADDLLALDEALQELSAADERKAQLVKLRYFVGLEIDKQHRRVFPRGRRIHAQPHRGRTRLLPPEGRIAASGQGGGFR